MCVGFGRMYKISCTCNLASDRLAIWSVVLRELGQRQLQVGHSILTSVHIAGPSAALQSPPPSVQLVISQSVLGRQEGVGTAGIWKCTS